MGGGVCIDPAERRLGSISSSEPSLSEVAASFEVRRRLPLVPQDDEDGPGDFDRCRDSSNGGKEMFDVGDGFCTCEVDSSSKSAPDNRLLRLNPVNEGLPFEVEKV